MNKPFVGLQLIRAAAATMVVISHIGRAFQAKAGTDITAFTAGGAAGVDLFFVVSGFIMIHTTRQPFSAAAFLSRRIIRVAPLYWLITALHGALILAVPATIHQSDFKPAAYLAAILFIPAYDASGGILPPVVQGWTLAYEMAFYAALAVASALAFAHRITILAAAFIAAIAAGLIWPPLSAGARNAAFVTYTDPILLDFLFGCGLAHLHHTGRLHASRTACLTLIGLGTAALLGGATLMGTSCPRVIYWGVPALTIVAGTVQGETLFDFAKHRLARAIGDSSYALYLSHMLVLSALALVFRFPAAHIAGGLPLAPALLAACLLAGWLVYRHIEQPLTTFLKRQLGPAAG